MDRLTAILFSGGKGSRLYPYTDYYQKVMLPIGKRGTPLLEIIISHLKSFGIRKYIMLVNYRANQIKQYFQNGNWMDIEIEYVYDKPGKKGTAHALNNASQFVDTRNILLYYTDILSSINVEEFYEFHKHHNKMGSIWIDENWETPIEHVIVNSQNQVVDLNKANSSVYVNTGISMFSNKIFEIINSSSKLGDELFDMSSDILPQLVSNDDVRAYVKDDWWLDIGNIYRHKLVTDELIDRKFPHLNLIKEV